MINLWKKFFGRNKNKKTEHELFLDFMRKKKDVMSTQMEKAMMKYLEDIYKYAVSAEKKEEKKKVKVATWVSRDKDIEMARERERKAKENALPHPIDKPIL